MLTGRFAPSPSGRMHLGNVFSALLAWLSVRSRGGRMLLRIEDLDPDRCRPEYAETLKHDLDWLGLDWDIGPYYQSERRAEYERALEVLKARGLVYPCFCTRAQLHATSAPHDSDGVFRYPGTCRDLTPEEIAQMESTGTAGGGMVTATVTGTSTLKSIAIKPDVVDPDDIDMLQDLVVAAVNEALKAASDKSQSQMSAITGGIGGGLGGLL